MDQIRPTNEPRKPYETPTIVRVSVSAPRELLQQSACAANDTLGCPKPLFS